MGINELVSKCGYFMFMVEVMSQNEECFRQNSSLNYVVNYLFVVSVLVSFIAFSALSFVFQYCSVCNFFRCKNLSGTYLVIYRLNKTI